MSVAEDIFVRHGQIGEVFMELHAAAGSMQLVAIHVVLHQHSSLCIRTHFAFFTAECLTVIAMVPTALFWMLYPFTWVSSTRLTSSRSIVIMLDLARLPTMDSCQFCNTVDYSICHCILV